MGSDFLVEIAIQQTNKLEYFINSYILIMPEYESFEKKLDIDTTAYNNQSTFIETVSELVSLLSSIYEK